jgi:hypothetical protein
VPTELAAPGWSERAVQQFGTDNLYEKIDGRAGYYEARGFRRLYYVYLVRDAGGPSAATGTPGAPGAAPGQTPGAPGATGATIDIEMYDLGTVANALGAYAGERQPDATPQVDGESISHIARNAMFLVRGPYYIRALGSDESEPVVAALKHLRARLTTALQGAPLPWTFPVFVAGLGVDPGAIGYVTENAFSFGFAHRVHTADIDDDGGQAFLVATADADAAAALAKQFADGFSSLGSPAGTHDGVIWSRTPFIETISGATAVRSAVIGVKDAADVDAARAALSRLKQTVQALPDDLLARAAQAQSPPQTAPGAETPAAGGDTDYDSHSSDQRGSGADGAGAAGSADPTDEY